MSAVCIIAPVVIGAAWPMISGAAVTVMVSLGYSLVSTINEDIKTNANISLKNSVKLDISNAEEVGVAVGREEELKFIKDGITVIFKRDIRGTLQVCVDSDIHSKSELEEIGQEFADKVIQKYVYNRVINQLDTTGMSIVDQEVDEDETIRIKLRSWE